MPVPAPGARASRGRVRVRWNPRAAVARALTALVSAVHGRGGGGQQASASPAAPAMVTAWAVRAGADRPTARSSPAPCWWVRRQLRLRGRSRRLGPRPAALSRRPRCCRPAAGGTTLGAGHASRRRLGSGPGPGAASATVLRVAVLVWSWLVTRSVGLQRSPAAGTAGPELTGRPGSRRGPPRSSRTAAFVTGASLPDPWRDRQGRTGVTPCLAIPADRNPMTRGGSAHQPASS
jgi:hypothetical protein